MSDQADRRRVRRVGAGGGGPRRGSSTSSRDNSTRKSERDSDRERASPPPPPPPPLRPIILAKPPSQEKRDASQESTASIKQVDKAIIMVKTRDDSKTVLSSSQKISPSDTYRKSLPLQSQSPVPVSQDGMSPQLRLALPVPMTQPCKLMDENLQWCENGLEFLLDQTDYFIIGAVGLQGAGKSTVLSMLACGAPDGEPLVFKPQLTDTVDSSSHQTVGVDMFVLSSRIILLDTQPVLSPSVLDTFNRQDRKFGIEFSTAENFNEIQSLQLLAFMYTVCNVVLVVQDWFSDPYFLKLLTTAEMLRPSIPSAGGESSQVIERVLDDFVPHVVFVQNKAKRADFTSAAITAIHDTIGRFFRKSKLRIRNGVSVTNGNFFPGLMLPSASNDVNLFILPWLQENGQDSDPFAVIIPEFKGHPEAEDMLKNLRDQLFQLPRQSFTHTPLTERNWFHFSARIWDGIKKSPVFAEYSRLMP